MKRRARPKAMTSLTTPDTASKGENMKKALIIGAAALMLSGCKFDPLRNDTQTVYGPPPTEESVTQPASETKMSETSIAETTSFDPAKNDNQTEYGAPLAEEEFDPADNAAVEMYGPPPTDITLAEDEDMALIAEDPEEIEEEEVAAEEAADDEELIDDGDE